MVQACGETVEHVEIVHKLKQNTKSKRLWLAQSKMEEYIAIERILEI